MDLKGHKQWETDGNGQKKTEIIRNKKRKTKQKWTKNPRKNTKTDAN